MRAQCGRLTVVRAADVEAGTDLMGVTDLPDVMLHSLANDGCAALARP